MLKYLILVVQNALATGILLAMFFVIAQLSQRPRLKTWLLWGSIVGVAAAFLLAILRETTLLINREYWNIGILSVSVLSGMLFCVLVSGVFSKKIPALDSERVWNVTFAIVAASLLFYCLPNIFLYPTDFAVMGESIFSTDFFFKLIGYLAGLLIVGLAGIALYNIGKRLSFNLVRNLIIIGLIINLVNQFSTIVQFLLARRIIPMSKVTFTFVKITINYNDLFLYSIMLITFLLPVILWINSLNPKDSYANPAQHRKIRAEARLQRRWCTVIVAEYLIAALSLTVIKRYSEREVVLSPTEPVDIIESDVVVSLDRVSDGHLHRFAFAASDGTEVRFIVIQKNAASYGVALDACDICGPAGYYERGDHEIVCKQCDVVMNISTIGFKGGCNPIPIAYTLDAGKIMIQTQNLENEKQRFA